MVQGKYNENAYMLWFQYLPLKYSILLLTQRIEKPKFVRIAFVTFNEIKFISTYDYGKNLKVLSPINTSDI